MDKFQKKKDFTPLIKLHLAYPFIEELRKSGTPYESVLHEYRLNSKDFNNAETMISARRMYRLLNRLAEYADDPYLGLCIGEKLDIDHWPLFIEAAKDSQLLADFFLRFTVKAQELASSVKPVLNIDSENVSFQMLRTTEPDFCPSQADSFYVSLFCRIFKKTLGKQWAPDKVRMQVCEIEAISTNYQQVRLSKGDNKGFRMIFPTHWLFYKITKNHHETQAQKKPDRKSIPPVNVLSSIHMALFPHLNNENLDTKMAAELCDFTPRVLNQKLHQYHTSLTKEIKKLRIQQAKELLSQTKKSINAISQETGFASQSAFTRLFKSMVGISPNQYRNYQNDKYRK